MRYSSRVPGEFAPNEFFRAVEGRRSAGSRLRDLTVSNPTLAGLDYPLEEIQSAMAQASRHAYEPNPRGLPTAREAVAAYYRSHGVSLPADSIILASGTSEAYGHLFKLLCAPGETVLYPQPSYPLIGSIAGLEGAAAHPYPLVGKDRRWNVPEISDSITAATRAVVAVSPNNPTGGMLTAGELRALSALCASRSLALVVDEVFLDYPAPARVSSVVSSAGNPDALTFTLGGLSKACGFPHLKLAWIAVSGPENEAREALARLEFIADAFLSVGTPVQQAAGALFELGATVRDQIRRRVDRNEERLRILLDGAPGAAVSSRDGGWYSVVGLPPGWEDEAFALRLLEEEDVIVQPGYLFDLEAEQAVIVSLLTPESIFEEGLRRVVRLLNNPASEDKP